MGHMAAVIALFVTSTMHHQMSLVTEYCYVNATYGSEAWEDGLRLAKRRRPSNGEQLPTLGHLVVFVGSVLLTVPFCLGACFLGCYLTMKLRGERFNEQMAGLRGECPDVYRDPTN